MSIATAQPTPEQWAQVDAELAARVSFVARLLAGEVPPDLEAVFDAASVALFPRTWKELVATCSCPDGQNPCKHIAAVLYVFADQLDADPWLLLAWRGRTRDALLAPLGSPPANADGARIAPWWPFADGPLPAGLLDASGDPLGGPPDDPAAVRARLEPLLVDVGGTPVVDLLPVAYELLAED